MFRSHDTLYTSREIMSLPLNRVELAHRGRKRRGLHVFMSRCAHEFRALSKDTQKELLIDSNIRNEEGDDGDCSLDSTDTLYDQPIVWREIQKLCFQKWRETTVRCKSAWARRADRLNRRKLPGLVVTLPVEIDKIAIMQSLSMEWEGLVKIFKRSICTAPKSIDSILEYKFGSERVCIHSQSFKTFNLSLLLKLTLFGRDYAKVVGEIRMKTKNTCLLHIASQSRMRDIFSLEKQSAAVFNTWRDGYGFIRTCCGKVTVLDAYGRKSVGYVLEELGDIWRIKLRQTNETISMRKLVYNLAEGHYDTGRSIKDEVGRRIVSFWPIRILFYNSGLCKMTINRVSWQERRPNNIVQKFEFTS